MERRRIEDTDSHVNLVGEELKKRVIGQEEAIEAIMDAIDGGRFREPNTPVASLAFIGPTGTGKTALAEALAEVRAIDKLNPALTRIDCANYASGHEQADLIGSPKGYVGYQDEPALKKEVIEQPHSVTLFDEAEKAHPKLWNVMLKFLEGGAIKLMNGDEINTANTTVIITSNVGSQEMQDTVSARRIGYQEDSAASNKQIELAALKAMKRTFPPEFINRFDAIIAFNSLSDEQLVEALNAHVEKENHRYRSMGNFVLKMSEPLKSHLVETADGRREYGFRPIKRNFKKKVVTELGRKSSRGLIGGHEVEADLEDEQVVFYEGQPINYSIAELTGMEEEDFMCETDEEER